MIVGCYTLDLYCSDPRCTRKGPLAGDGGRGPLAQYTHELGAVCRRHARRAGWILRLREGTATCPTCAKRNKGSEAR